MKLVMARLSTILPHPTCLLSALPSFIYYSLLSLPALISFLLSLHSYLFSFFSTYVLLWLLDFISPPCSSLINLLPTSSPFLWGYLHWLCLKAPCRAFCNHRRSFFPGSFQSPKDAPVTPRDQA